MTCSEFVVRAYLPARRMKRSRSSLSVLKTPVNWVVMVDTFGWWTPRVVMHSCFASMRTATP